MPNSQSPLLARQPILNQKLKIVGYELLCRPVPKDNEDWQNEYGDAATSEVLISAFNDIGIDLVTDGLPAFINFTRYWLHHPPLLSTKNVVAEILEYIIPEESNLAAVKRLHNLGYKLALDDYQGNHEQSVFFPYIHIIKVDLRLLSSLEVLPQLIEKYKEHNLVWLAEKVETLEEFELCKAAGCTLFQGYFFSHPMNVYGNRLPDSHMAVLQLLHVLNNENATIDEVASILKTDPQLSFKVLKTVNSAAFGLSREIGSIQQAIMMLGLNRLRAWANVIALGKLNHKPDVLREQALVRATLCKSLVFAWPALDAEIAFTIGLFSLLPAFLDQPLEDICQQLHLPDSITQALMHHKGEYGLILKTTIAMEKGYWDDIQWQQLEKAHISAAQLQNYYIQSLQNAKHLLNGLIH